MTVNKELIKLWIDTLRSDEYQQGSTVLRTIDDKFCCLGVLCDIAKESVGLDWKLEESDDLSYLIEDTCTVLPNLLINYLGLNSDCVLIVKTNTKLQEYLGDRIDAIPTLVALNDYYHLSFGQIADILEEEFLNEDKTINVA